MSRKKINWLVILQAWAMLWVVVGHSFLGEPGNGPTWENMLFHYAYSFHMPLFMLISGWLYWKTRLDADLNLGGGGKKWSYSQIVKDKTLRLLLPGLVFSVLAIVLKAAMPGEMERQISLSVYDIIFAYLYPINNPLRELWFIATLFWLMVVAPFWQFVLKKKMLSILIAIVLVALNLLKLEIDFLCIGQVGKYALWFYLGLVCSKVQLVGRVYNQYWQIMVIGIICQVCGMWTLPLITTIGGILFSLGIALFFDKYSNRIFSSFRNYTYQIFLMGIFAQIAVKILYRHLNMPYVVGFMLCVTVGIYIPVLVSKIMEWANNRTLLLCIGLKKR